jgi:hypothetical protein
MAETTRPVDPTRRLVDQLNALSELTESLAFRLVELEERLAASEMLIQPLLEAATAAGPAEYTELRLDDTEDRIARLESLLNGVASAAGGKPDPHPAVLEDPDPFIEDGEQPFMDELVA